MQRSDALKLVEDWTQNRNLVRHMLAVEAEMRALAVHFGEDPELWGLAGLLHDGDYDKYPDEHPLKLLEELEARKVDPQVIGAVRAHAWGRHDLPEPQTKMEWAIYTCDELSGLIVASTLVLPDKKISSVSVDAVLRRFKEKAFARGVHREQVALCEEKLGVPLNEFVGICLKGMQGIAGDLGL